MTLIAEIYTESAIFAVEKRGTQAVTGNPDWTSVIFQARVRPEADSAIGLLFRYVNVQNYYRLALETNHLPTLPPAPPGLVTKRSLRLVKKVAGV